jgi:hypothetical protein
MLSVWKVLEAVICLLLMFTIVGHPIAAIWAVLVVHSALADARTRRIEKAARTAAAARFEPGRRRESGRDGSPRHGAGEDRETRQPGAQVVDFGHCCGPLGPVRRGGVASVEGTLETMAKELQGFHGPSVLRSR